MAKYRKKPIVVEAYQTDVAFFIDTLELQAAVRQMTFDRPHDSVADVYKLAKEKLGARALIGALHASVGDWIVTGINGGIRICKPNIFEATYERVESDTNAE